jgi:hypothetical protein
MLTFMNHLPTPDTTNVKRVGQDMVDMSAREWAFVGSAFSVAATCLCSG